MGYKSGMIDVDQQLSCDKVTKFGERPVSLRSLIATDAVRAFQFRCLSR